MGKKVEKERNEIVEEFFRIMLIIKKFNILHCLFLSPPNIFNHIFEKFKK